MSDAEYRPASELKDEYNPITVPGTACMWFAWSDPNINGPERENPVLNYRPIWVPIAGIAEIEITADQNDQWWHHPGVKSNAGGINSERDLQNQAYKSPTYSSQNIKTLKARLNLLVGMYGDENPPANPVDQFGIGLGDTLDLNNVNATRLYLAFHDGHEWSNNGGQANVTIRITKRR